MKPLTVRVGAYTEYYYTGTVPSGFGLCPSARS